MTFRADWHSLQVRFWFILGCAVLPLLLIFLWGFRSEYQHQVKMAESRVLQVLNVSKRFEQVALEQASLILGIMSKANELDTLDPEACNGLAQRLQRSSPQLANLGAVHANGVVFCSAQPAPSPVNVSDRVWFKEALALDSQRLTSGEFVIDRISRQPGIVFGYPLKRDGAAADLMLFASMHMDFFRPVVESLPDEPGWQIQILRRDGSVLMSHPPAAPDVVAHASTTFTLDAALLSRLTNGQTIHQSPDRQGNLRLVGLKTMDVASNELVLSVTAPLHLSINRLRAALAWELAGLLALLLFSVGLARWQIYGLVEDWTARIQKVLRQIGQGQLDASMSPASTIRELADVEQGLAHMTNKLRAKHDENLRLLQAIEQSPVSVVITDPSGKIEYVNRKFVEISGYSKDEVLGKNPKILNHGITPRPVYETLWATLTRGEVWIGEFINTRKD